MRRSRLLVWRKSRNELWNNTCVYVLRKPGQCRVQMWIRTCERRWTQTVGPRQRKLVPRCQRVLAVTKHEKRECRFRIAKCSNCGKTRHLRAMCRQRQKSAGKSSPSSSSGKSSGKDGTNRGSTNKCYCCGQVGYRCSDCPGRNERLAVSVTSVVI